MLSHSVEKIGGTSMSRTDSLLENVLIGDRKDAELYNRIFVVSAYGGFTDLLLEHKKSGEHGVYGLFASAESGWNWGDALTDVGERMLARNAEIFADSHGAGDGRCLYPGTDRRGALLPHRPAAPLFLWPFPTRTASSDGAGDAGVPG